MPSKEMRTILVVCGCGFATSALIIDSLRREFEKRGYKDIKIIDDSLLNISHHKGEKIDLIISSNPIDPEVLGEWKFFRSFALLTGVGIESDMDQIIKALESK